MLCFFGLVTIMKEGKKAPVNIRISSLKFVVQFFYGRVGIGSRFLNLLRCKSTFIIANFIDSGRVGIGSWFLNFISCKSVSACRLLPSLPALLLPRISSAAKVKLLPAPLAALHCSCSVACVLCANSACSPAIIKSASAAALIFLFFSAGYASARAWFRCKLPVHQIHCLAFPLAKFRLSCTALLIAAVDLLPGLLQLPVKLYS